MARKAFEEVSLYLRQMSGSRTLDREEEVRLAQRMRRGDLAARDQLIFNNLPFVVRVAMRYVGAGARLDDLIQVGNLGLLKATETFDPALGNRFITYAAWQIRSNMVHYRKDHRSEVRGGEKARGTMHDLCLDAPLAEGTGTHLDLLADTAPGAFEHLHHEQQNADIRSALQQVKKRLGAMGWDILQERLSADEPMTLEHLGQRWGVSRERIRQLEVRTKQFLKVYLSSLAAT